MKQSCQSIGTNDDENQIPPNPPLAKGGRGDFQKKTDIDEVSNIMRGYFQRHHEIEVAYIFGSVTKGKINALSDIDIAVIVDKDQVNEKLYRYGYKAELLTDLIKLLKTNNVDLVILNEVNPLLKHRVLYFGKVIYSKNEKKRIQFQIDTINKYNDFKQIIKPHNLTGIGLK